MGWESHGGGGWRGGSSLWSSQSSRTILPPSQGLSQAIFRNTSSTQLLEPSTEEPKERSGREADLRLQKASEGIDGVSRVPRRHKNWYLLQPSLVPKAVTDTFLLASDTTWHGPKIPSCCHLLSSCAKALT